MQSNAASPSVSSSSWIDGASTIPRPLPDQSSWREHLDPLPPRTTAIGKGSFEWWVSDHSTADVQ